MISLITTSLSAVKDLDTRHTRAPQRLIKLDRDQRILSFTSEGICAGTTLRRYHQYTWYRSKIRYSVRFRRRYWRNEVIVT
ncbi:hypothetical protein KCP71_25705 [Salmonella enterica subsp. enterica]|nr:hypothetical protein KCP71_25705 [Salmonella enterica subsp. enterica]